MIFVEAAKGNGRWRDQFAREFQELGISNQWLGRRAKCMRNHPSNSTFDIRSERVCLFLWLDRVRIVFSSLGLISSAFGEWFVHLKKARMSLDRTKRPSRRKSFLINPKMEDFNILSLSSSQQLMGWVPNFLALDVMTWLFDVSHGP